ncbi:hypothetical protein NMY22_g19908 [Coprinellus aureogranulatus]|nr:hypothetical protein NMY22_g19908 [Coprinellus aureogranulatus]
MGDKPDTYKAQHFENYIHPDTPADAWWEGLNEETKGSWSAIKAAFELKWPSKKVVWKTATEFEEELLGSRLTLEELGKREEVDGIRRYGHIRWAENMLELAKGAGVQSGSTYIGQVIRNLPRLLKDKLSSTYDTWNAFFDAICAVDAEYLRESAARCIREEKEMEELRARLRLLESSRARRDAEKKYNKDKNADNKKALDRAKLAEDKQRDLMEGNREQLEYWQSEKPSRPGTPTRSPPKKRPGMK